MTKPVYSLQEYSYEVNGSSLLYELTVDIYEHEYLVIVGPNGAGKSTLLKCLNCLNIGGQGQLTLYDKSVTEYSRKQLAQHVGYVPQHMSPSISVSVYDFVAMSRYPYLGAFGPMGIEHEEAIKKALSNTHLEDLADRALHTLSGGERQRVLIAGALAQETNILLMDEPTTFLDPGQQAEMYQLLNALRDNHPHLTIVAVTHDVNYASMAADRILALSGGKRVFCGEPTDFMNKEVLDELYSTSFTLVNHPESGHLIALPEQIG
jgi:ABC-type cobalamin/Fe3+-siderophores transport system ATPase subunit